MKCLTKVDLKKIKPIFWDFERHFKIDDIKYEFFAKEMESGHWTILFNRIDENGDPTFDLLNSNKYSGKIFSVIFQCLEELIKKHKIKTFGFGSELRYNLFKFYDNDTLIKLIQKRFNFKLIDTKIVNNVKYWYYQK